MLHKDEADLLYWQMRQWQINQTDTNILQQISQIHGF